MSKTCGLLAIAALLCSLPAHAAEKKCVLLRTAEMPVTMSDMRPLISGTINGRPARFVAASGAFFSMLAREASDRYGLRTGPLPSPFSVKATNGSTITVWGKADKFSLDGFHAGEVFEDISFIVGTNMLGRDADGIVGQNVIGIADAEYDLANGFIRLFHAKDCNGQMLAYWAKNINVAEIAFEPRAARQPHVIGAAKLNGKKIRVLFDTGTRTSVLTLSAASRAGIKPEDEDVAAGGISLVGKKSKENWIASFDSLELGGERITNARLRMTNIAIPELADMVLGADFFLSHRVYVATEDRKIYFTYNGGPIFDLRGRNTPTLAGQDEPDAAVEETSTEEIDAAGLRRRGTASASRRDFQAAIADFDRAIELDATDPESYHQRGLAYLQTNRPLLGLKDFDAALKLKPDHAPTLLSRGTLRLMDKDKPGAVADFDVAAGVMPDDAELLLRIGRSFLNAGEYAEAIARFDAWEKKYPKDERLSEMLNDRCWSRALANRDLNLALEDCNRALMTGPRHSAVYDSRAFVRLRQGNFDKSIADYNAALNLQPKQALSMYGRGLAKLKKGKTPEGEVDIKAALEIDPEAAEIFKQAGIEP
jgi:tetratricopeptide (TPR) repeat protein